MNGRCLCGAVRFTVPDDRRGIGVCHCGICRRWGGGPMLAVHCGPDVRISEGADKVRTYASSEWAERAFCQVCGTHLYCKVHASGDHFVAAGTLDSDELRITGQTFIDGKLPYYDLVNQTPKFTEQQVLEMFASGKAGGAA